MLLFFVFRNNTNFIYISYILQFANHFDWCTKLYKHFKEKSENYAESDTEIDAKSDVAAIRANHPIPSQCRLFYFEVEIIDKGKTGYVRFINFLLQIDSNSLIFYIFKREIGFGFCTKTVNLNILPGN